MRTWKFQPQESCLLREALTKRTKLSVEQLSEGAMKGALWLQHKKGKTLRVRSLDIKVTAQDTISLFYDPKVLRLPPLKSARCLFENLHYGVWVKEAGVVPQGTQTGDHASLLRYIEIQKKKEVYLVHRLDRETAGLMVFAYDSETAAYLSELFQKNLVKKEYEAIVLGEMPLGHKQTIDVSLDDKKAISHIEVLDSRAGQSLIKVRLDTGRFHQIRRHLEHIGHPVIGDPKYGKRNKNREGLKLLARSLAFNDPKTKEIVEFRLDEGLSD